MIRNLKIEGSDVSFTIMLTTPACPLKGKMEADSRAALASVPGIGKITINWDANVPN
jgi:ATP-binding protein involved in chromosome partitioning